jgi:SAM-dependent methyltransferase
MSSDPFVQLKAVQREGWSLFGPLEVFTTVPAARLVRFANVAPNEQVLDVGCGTGVVAVTAARAGASVRALDLTPALLERARQNARIAGVRIDLVEGDAEALPYPDASFDVVLSQFGHMFAPRPNMAIEEMLRVLKPGGRVAFTTWPPELFTGALFATIGRYAPPPPPGVIPPAPPPEWGDPSIVRERLGNAVIDLVFDRDVMISPTLSPQHARAMLEATLGPLIKVVASLEKEPARLVQLRAEVETLLGNIFTDNHLRQHYLLTRATKKT